MNDRVERFVPRVRCPASIVEGAGPARPRMPARSLAWIAAGMCMAGLSTGCFAPPKSPHEIELERQVVQLTSENEALGRELAERDGKIEALRRKVDELQDLGPGRFSNLFAPRRLKIGKLTGGADYDGEPGDDGITVYLTPIDRDGDPVKTAGEIEVFLYDLTVPGRPRELGHYIVNEPAALSRTWYSGWLTNHYTVKCEWPPGVEPPPSREVQVRATFLDWLTGEKLAATELVTVDWVDRD